MIFLPSVNDLLPTVAAIVCGCVGDMLNLFVNRKHTDVLLELGEGIGYITLNRPQENNCINEGILEGRVPHMQTVADISDCLADVDLGFA
eukprot:5565127-Amphidinium_carterae.1